ncbi:MAG: hypothetical protein Q8N33_06255 [Rhodocyclaceae bacterium]|nr:hypothetical protein [Rhodocyclaceae bacterium]
MLFLNRALSIQGGHALDFIGVSKPIFYLVAPRFSGCALLNATSAALATSGGSHFHAVLPHALQKQIYGSDRNN